MKENKKINWHDINLLLISLYDTSDRLNLILEELKELERSLDFIVNIIDADKYISKNKRHFIKDVHNYVNEILIPDVYETAEDIYKYINKIKTYINNKNCYDITLKNNRIHILFDYIKFNERIYEKINYILEAQQLIINAETQFVDILPDQMILPPRTHYRRSYQVLEMQNMIRRAYEEAVSKIFDKVILDKNNINNNNCKIYKNIPIYKENNIPNNLLVNTHRVESVTHIRNFFNSSKNLFEIDNNNKKNNYIINSPFWFLASPRYLPILAHEIAHASLPEDILAHPECINRFVRELMLECYKELEKLYYDYHISISKKENITWKWVNRPHDVILEVLADVIALITAGPYYIYALFNVYINSNVKLEDMIKLKLINVFTRLDVLVQILYDLDYLSPEKNINDNNNNKDDISVVNALIKFDMSEMKRLIDDYKYGLKNNYYFIYDDKLLYSYNYYSFNEEITQILTYYFKKLVDYIYKKLSNKEFQKYLFHFRKLIDKKNEDNKRNVDHSIDKNNNLDYFIAHVYILYTFSAAKRLTLFPYNDNDKIQCIKINNNNIIDFLKETKFYELKKDIFMKNISNEKFILSKKILQNIPHLIWIMTALQNKIDIYKEEIFHEEIKDVDLIKLINKIFNVNNLNKNNRNIFKYLLNKNLSSEEILTRTYTEVPFLKYLFHFYNMINRCSNLNEENEKEENDNKLNENMMLRLKKEEIDDEVIYKINNIYNRVYKNFYIRKNDENVLKEIKKIDINHRGLRLFYFYDFYLYTNNIINDYDFNNNVLINIIDETIKYTKESNIHNFITIGHFDLLQIIDPDKPRRKFKIFEKEEKRKNNNINKNIHYYYRNIENEEIFIRVRDEKNENIIDNINEYIGYNNNNNNNKSFFNALTGIRFFRKDGKCFTDLNILIKLLITKVKNYNNNNKNENKIGIGHIYKSTSLHDIYVIWEFNRLIHFKQFFSELLAYPGSNEIYIQNSITYLLINRKNINYFDKKNIDNIIKKLNENFDKKINKNKIILITYGKSKYNINDTAEFSSKTNINNVNKKDIKFVNINKASGRNDIDVKWDIYFDNNLSDEEFFQVYIYILNILLKKYKIYRFETSFLGESEKLEL